MFDAPDSGCMVRDAADPFEALRVANAMMSVGVTPFSITVSPTGRYEVWGHWRFTTVSMMGGSRDHMCREVERALRQAKGGA